MHNANREPIATQSGRGQEPQGIQAVEQGFTIVQAVSESRSPLSLTELSSQCGMSKSQLHRYLVSLCRLGLLTKGPDLRYSLGTEAIIIGLRASEQIDVRTLSESYLNRMNERFNETAALAVWSESGPFFIRWQESNRSVKIGIQVGSRVTLTSSATGMVFCAFMPRDRIQQLLAVESAEAKVDRVQLEEDLQTIRETGYAVTEGGFIPGISAISVPVFNQFSQLAAALTLVGVVGVLPVAVNSPHVQTMREFGRALSKDLGYLRP
ncbi:IclR family transcriptional regulator [Alicyclobacillus sp. ALC3]|uniref:IclR family transcriptional regulator n=1 Tax=Alicyclobacillus sp. ALC3 TaxID=2796143 RepID=UPI002379902D|nr:IclR family transcriptional regulator [Alicyclobacillus sp. ALC3]WDL97624.1 IclR family transcriptional regulator [Alicyclobacillus sp. ALC3]